MHQVAQLQTHLLLPSKSQTNLKPNPQPPLAPTPNLKTQHHRDGGTIPALAYFQEILSVPTTIFSFSLGDHIHAPNERLKVGWSSFKKGG